MPRYSYTSRDGQTIELHFTMSAKRPDTIRRNGKKFFRDVVADFSSRRDICSCWPRKSDALGVNPSQVQEAGEALEKAGIPTQFDRKSGEMILESRQHQNRVMKHLGFCHWNAGYGDVAPGTTKIEERMQAAG